MKPTSTSETVVEAVHSGDTGVVGRLGLDGSIFLAQLVNFAIVLFVLKKFVFGPVVKRLEERTKRIDEGLKQAQDAQKRLGEIDALKEETKVDVKRQTAVLLIAAKKDAEILRTSMLEKAKEDVAHIVKKGKEQLLAERQASVRELRAQIADLAVATAKKILESELDEKRANLLAEKAVKEAFH